MNQLGLFDEPPRQRPLPQPVDLPAVRHCSRPEVRYCNPDEPMHTWTGRGKPPRWITEWVESGKTLEALRVPGTKP